MKRRFQPLSYCLFKLWTLPRTFPKSLFLFHLLKTPTSSHGPSQFPNPSQTPPSATAKKPQCFEKQNSMFPPWLNSLGLDLANGKIIKAAKMQGVMKSRDNTGWCDKAQREQSSCPACAQGREGSEPAPAPRLCPHCKLLTGTQHWTHRCAPAAPEHVQSWHCVLVWASSCVPLPPTLMPS